MNRLITFICLSVVALQSHAAINFVNDVAPGEKATVVTTTNKPVTVNSATFSTLECGGFTSAAEHQRLLIGE